MDMTSWLLLTLGVVLTVSALVVVLLGLLAYKLICRTGRVWLAVRAAFVPPGPHREVIQLRVQLSKEVLGSRRALATLDNRRAIRGELEILVRRLEQVARTLDTQLRLLSGEPDDNLLREFLPPARVRVGEIVGSSRRIRQITIAMLGGETDDTLHELTSDVDREVLALQAGVDALRALTLRELEARQRVKL